MRIALIAHHTAPIAPPFIGGVESQTWYLARWLAARGHDVTLFAMEGSDVPGVTLRPLAMDPATFSARSRKDVSSGPDAFLAAHHAYLGVMTELARRCPFDVVHVNTLHYLPVAMAATLPVRPMLTLHCPPTPWLESALRLAGTRGPLPLGVTVVSNALARSWEHAVRDPSVVLNGVDLGRWAPGPGGEGAAWVGRIVPEKAPHLAIDAARRAGMAIRLAGPVIDGAYWRAEVEPRLGPDAVHVGHLPHDALVALVGSARVAIHSPAWDEPFGLTAAEAIACGTPVAAFDRGGLREVVGGASGALAQAGDVASLAAACQQAATLDRAGVRADAEHRLGVDAMGAGYERCYRASIAAARHAERRWRPVTLDAVTAPSTAASPALSTAATAATESSSPLAA